MQNKEIEEDIKEVNIIITSIRKILQKDVKITDEAVYALDGRQYLAIENLSEYIKYLENKVKELGKGQHTLMQSRKKWKNIYYKERRKRKEADKAVEQIYDNYQDIGNMYFNLDEKVQNVIIYLKDTIIKCCNDTENEELSDWEKSISRAVGSELVKILNKLEDEDKEKRENDNCTSNKNQKR